MTDTVSMDTTGEVISDVGQALSSLGDSFKRVSDPKVAEAGRLLEMMGNALQWEGSAASIADSKGVWQAEGEMIGSYLGAAITTSLGPVALEASVLIWGPWVYPVVETLALTCPPFAMALLGVGAAAGAIYLGSKAGELIGHYLGANLDSGPLHTLLHLPDPLTFDLDGDGLELTSFASSSVYFDTDGDGFKQRTAWIDADDGVLALDRNSDGQIGGANELFGGATGGFSALKLLDSNSDGIINSLDTEFGSLLIWKDINQNGLGEAGELFHLTDLAITSIDLNAQNTRVENSGNIISATSTFEMNGVSHEVANVQLAGSSFETMFAGGDALPYDPGIFQLPQLRGYGGMPDLRTAMVMDGDLRSQVESIVANRNSYANFEALSADVASMLIEWAGASALDSSSRGDHVDARHLAVLETFLGTDFVGDPNALRGAQVEAAWDNLVQQSTARFAIQLAHIEQTHDFTAAIGDAMEQLRADPDMTQAELNAIVSGAAALIQPPADNYIGLFASLQFDTLEDTINGNMHEFLGAFMPGFVHSVYQGVQSQSNDAASGFQELSTVLSANIDPTFDNLRQLISSVTDAGLVRSDLSIIGSASPDVLAGTAGGDLMLSGAGDDHLNGGNGGDVYLWSRGDGNDIITDVAMNGGVDSLLLDGVNAEDVVLVRDGINVTIDVGPSTSGGGDGGSIKLIASLDESYGQGLEQIVLSDGTIWSRHDLRQMLLEQAVTNGHDNIVGFLADDTLRGGEGNDSLNGGEGNDTYLWARGDGDDTITENTNAGANDWLVLSDVNSTDVTLIQTVDSALVVRVAPSAVGADDGGDVRLASSLSYYYDAGIEGVAFADGVTWTRSDILKLLIDQQCTSGDDVIYGFNTYDVITGGAGADTINGWLGDDTYIWSHGDGDDTIHETINNGSVDKVVLHGVDPSDVSLVRVSNGNDLTLQIAPSTVGGSDGASISLYQSLDDFFDVGVEEIVFDNGTVWDRDYLRAAVLAQATTSGNDAIIGFEVNDLLEGGAGNDTITAKGGDDVINGGTGDDQILGGDGNDTYTWAYGDGDDTIIETPFGGAVDQLVLSVNPGAVTVTRSGADVLLQIAPSTTGGSDGGALTLVGNLDEWMNQGIDKIVFADSTIWTRDDLRNMTAIPGTAGNDTLSGTNAPETLSGQAGADVINGYAGADIIIGGADDDALNGGDGDDSYLWSRGDGDDIVTDGVGGGQHDRLVLQGVNSTDVTLVRNGWDVTLQIAPTTLGGADGGSVKLISSLDYYYDAGVESIAFADGVIWGLSELHAAMFAQLSTSGADTIAGFNTNDTITGGAGDDMINGGLGDDTYVWARGDGEDTITETTSNGSADKLVLHGVVPADVTLIRINNGNDLTLEIAPSSVGGSDGGSINLYSSLEYYYDIGIEQVVFDNGTTWNRNDLRALAIAQAATSGNDSIYGINGSNDTIVGGTGADYEDGRSGDDSYVWSRGDGNDTIHEDPFNGTADRLVLHGVSSADVTFVRAGASNDLVLQIAPSTPGGGDGASISLFSSLEDYYGIGIEQIVFDNGTTWSRNDLRALVVAQYGTSGDDVICGVNASNDTIVGGLGLDAMAGLTGSDTFKFLSVADSPAGASVDTITDFTQGQDLIDLGEIDANSGLAGDQAFSWLGTAAFTGTSGELRYAVSSGVSMIYGDIDGDGVADFQVQILGGMTLQSADFVF